MKNLFMAGVLLLTLFVGAVLFGNKPYVKEARVGVKALFIVSLNDQPEGLSIKRNSKYLAKLRDQYSDTPPLPEMITIAEGAYTKGCTFEKCKEYYDETMEPKRLVVQSFQIAETELTVEQWDVCVAMGGCDHLPKNYKWGRGDLPVLNVSWDDVQQYIKWLNSITDGGYRLPTDAEWEYAARAGSDTRYPWGETLPDCDQARLGSPSWVPKSEWECKIDGTWPVKSKEPNAWGLYHVIGNAAEWVQECGDILYVGGKRVKDTNPVCGNRLNRGGNWCTLAETVNVLHSRNYQASHRYNRVGFRLARSLN